MTIAGARYWMSLRVRDDFPSHKTASKDLYIFHIKQNKMKMMMKNALIKLDPKSTLKAAGLYRISMFYYVALLIKRTIWKPVKI